MSEEIKVSASDRSLIKIIDDANYSGYGKAVTAEIERLQAQLSALQKENAELKKQVEWRKEHMEESDKELVQIQDWLRAGGDIFISSSEMMARVKERIRDLIAIEGEAGDLRTQNRELREALQLVADEHSRCMREVSEIGFSDFNYTAGMACAINKALALQPEK